MIKETIATLFSGNGKGGSATLDSLEKFSIPEGANIDNGVTVVDCLVTVGFASSKGEAKRLIKGGGAKVNDVKVAEDTATINRADFDENGRVKISSGKKKNALIVL